ncbi:MAG: penicillin-binding protein 2 [bacterium]
MLKRKGSKKSGNNNRRIQILIVATIIIVGAIIFRLFWIQVLNHDYYYARAQDQYTIYDELVPDRGEIFVEDKLGNLYPVATNQKVHLVYADPRKIDDPKDVAVKLAPLLLNEDAVDEENNEEEVLVSTEDEIMKRLKDKNDPYEPLKRGVNDETWKKIDELNLPGIYSAASKSRYYPEGELASHVIGYVGINENSWLGQYGLEGHYENELKGSGGFFETEQDALGNWISAGDRQVVEATDGDSLVLTIDRRAQYESEAILKELVEARGAESGSVIVMHPKTGEILVMGNYPNFDPNKYNEVEDINVFQNASIYKAWEPGSVFKVITMGSAMNVGAVTANTYYTDKGSEEIAGYTIKNFDGQARGNINMTDVLVQSINTGVMFAEKQMGHSAFNEYVQKFGFGELTKIDLDTEAKGDVSPLAQEKDIYAATASFGQGITVTPIQMLAAVSAIANKGTLIKPYVVKKIISPDGTETETQPEQIRDVLSPGIASTLGAMMVSVIENGHQTAAGVDGYLVAGKTGTAQVASSSGNGYDPNKTIHSFVGFAPLSDPEILLFIKIDKPTSGQFAANTISPYFGRLMKFLLEYYQVTPDR